MSKRKYLKDFWTNDKIINEFDKICKKSEKISIDWKKFRANDKNGTFKNITNGYLAVFFFKRRRILNGICLECGENKSAKSSHYCNKCLKLKKSEK